MAINFLNNVDYNQNQLFHPTIENQPNDTAAGTPVDGQLYYNTSATPGLKVGENGAWVFVGGGVESITTANSNYVNLADTGTAADPILTASLNAVDGTAAETATGNGIRYLSKNNKWAEIDAIPGTYTWTVSDGTNSTAVASGETVTFLGTANEIEVAESGRTVTIGLPDDVTITNDLTVSGAGDFTGQVTIPILPVASTDAASKDYVDNAIVGGLVYQGGYDANLNSPDLTTSPNSILKGWTYTVTADGTFFGEQLRVGDVLIAEVNDPSALTDWTTVQNNIDLASLTQVGIGNVNAEPAGNLGGIAVSYTSGTAKVGLGIAALGVDPLAETPADYFIPIYNSADDENKKVASSDLLTAINSVTSKTGTITAGNLSGTVTHDFGINTIVQTISSSGDTVFCDVTRTATTSVATIAVAEATDITILVQKIG